MQKNGLQNPSLIIKAPILFGYDALDSLREKTPELKDIGLDTLNP